MKKSLWLPPRFRAQGMQQQQTELDTVRWGDIFSFVIPISTGAIFTLPLSSSHQLAKCKWRWPLTWQAVTITTMTPGAGETASFEVIYTFTIGVGGGQASMIRGVSLTAADGYSQKSDLFQLPGQDIQVSSTFFSAGILTGTTPGNLQTAAFLAPVTEPHVMTEMLRHMTGESGGARWMTGNGFQEERMHYQK
jgi:hypothetical protein